VEPRIIKKTEAIEVLSDKIEGDLGPDVNQYIKDKVLHSVRWNWNILFPDLARPPISKQGTVAIEFSILKDGTIGGMKLVGSTADVSQHPETLIVRVQMERAAWGSIFNSTPFPPLPKEFTGSFLPLRLLFDYNTGAKKPGFTISPLEASVDVSSTQQFLAVDNGKDAIVTWSIDGCNEDCGTISSTGLYTAGPKVSSPPKVTVRASLTSNSAYNVSATVTVVAPKP